MVTHDSVAEEDDEPDERLGQRCEACGYVGIVSKSRFGWLCIEPDDGSKAMIFPSDFCRLVRDDHKKADDTDNDVEEELDTAAFATTLPKADDVGSDVKGERVTGDDAHDERRPTAVISPPGNAQAQAKSQEKSTFRAIVAFALSEVDSEADIDTALQKADVDERDPSTFYEARWDFVARP